MRLNLRISLVCMAISLSPFVLAQVRAPTPKVPTKASPAEKTALPTTTQPTPVTVEVVQPTTPPKGRIETYAPYVVAFLGLLGVFATAAYTFRRGQMDARYAYASEITKFRLQQIQEFYAPALAYIEQSRVVYEKFRWTIGEYRKEIPVEGFRLLDHIYEFKDDPNLAPLIDKILTIGKNLSALISQKAGLIEGGITSTPTFIEYLGHLEILNAAREQKPTEEEKEGWHQIGYYPRLLNREIIEGYKVVFAQLENCIKAGDKIMFKLLGQEPSRLREFRHQLKVMLAKLDDTATAEEESMFQPPEQKPNQLAEYRRQLIENLRFYERNVKDYSKRFDTFDLSGIRQRFIDSVENTRGERSEAIGSGVIEILDAGCGTGRDAYEFVKKGYAVTAIDASPAMLRMCKKKLNDVLNEPQNIEIKKASSFLEKTFDEIVFRSCFDGVWAAASLLHVPPQQMEAVLRKLVQALKPHGILFMSFKHGCGEHEYDARYYTYYSRGQIRAFLKRIQGAYELDSWLSDAKGKDLPKEEQSQAWHDESFNRYDRSRWLNVLVTRRRR
jgi:SAM-dependent methyltransferase